jgi:Domain of unknown function (DUF4412)
MLRREMARLLSIPGPSAAAGLLVLWSGAGAASADLTMVSHLSGLKGSQTVTEYVSGDKVRLKEGDFETLFDTAAGSLVSIDHAGKSYYETSLDEIQRYVAALHAAEPAPAAVSVRKGDTPKTIAGHGCEHYLLSQGSFSLEVWVDPQLEAPAHAEAERIAAARSGAASAGLQPLYAELKKIKGLPLAELRSGGSGRLTTRSRREAVEVKLGALPASTFEVPAGYQKKDSPYRVAPRRPQPPKAR